MPDVANVDNDGTYSNNIILVIKDTKLYVPVATSSAKEIRNYQNFLAKDLKDQSFGMNIKKSKNKICQMRIDIFSNQTLQDLSDPLFLFI